MGNLLSKKQNNWFKYERETHSVVFRNGGVKLVQTDATGRVCWRNPLYKTQPTHYDVDGNECKECNCRRIHCVQIDNEDSWRSFHEMKTMQDLVREFTNYTYSFIAMKRCQCAILTSIRLPFRESVCSFFCGKVKMVQTTD